MKTQIKKWGNCYVIVVPPEAMKFYDFKEGDWVDISDLVKIRKQIKRG